MTAAREELLSIGQVAERTGLSVSAIRFYESEKLVTAIRNAGGAPAFSTLGPAPPVVHSDRTADGFLAQHDQSNPGEPAQGPNADAAGLGPHQP